MMKNRWMMSLVAIVALGFMGSLASAQQQQELLVVQQRAQLQQVQFLNVRNDVLRVALNNRGDSPSSLTADELTAVSETLNQFAAALEKERGDNELAATFNYEEGTITRHKPASAPEILKFDPSGEQSLREWLTLQMPPNVLRDWMKGGFFPNKTEDGRIFVQMTPSNLIGPVHVFELEKQGDALRIRAIVSRTSGC